MTKTELIDMLDEYKMGLLSKATDGTIDDKYYIKKLFIGKCKH